ncbi:hypothetical protein Zmor_026220 [Zophobas morio]|uniref:Uncharacterized protein n=1 Tax=Zophobas morio TaxID=2755281 RepID=A0AA38HT69_9CUCU|nr:hypothetical protein Zmor_026220 [Zophobas morio]
MCRIFQAENVATGLLTRKHSRTLKNHLSLKLFARICKNPTPSNPTQPVTIASGHIKTHSTRKWPTFKAKDYARPDLPHDKRSPTPGNGYRIQRRATASLIGVSPSKNWKNPFQPSPAFQFSAIAANYGRIKLADCTSRAFSDVAHSPDILPLANSG